MIAAAGAERDPAVARGMAYGCRWLALVADRAAAREAAAQEAAETAVLRTVIERSERLGVLLIPEAVLMRDVARAAGERPG